MQLIHKYLKLSPYIQDVQDCQKYVKFYKLTVLTYYVC